MSSSILELFSTLGQCFFIILVGYIAGKRLQPNTTKALYFYIDYLALPSLIFTSLVSFDLNEINLKLVGCIFVAKTAVFVLVVVVTFIVTKPIDLSKAGLYAIAATQSNDFALGYPILASIYANTPYPHYVYFLAPIQLLILNPVGFILIELNKKERYQCIFGKVLKGMLCNPVIVMTLLGLIINLIFGANKVPSFLTQLTGVLGSSFSGTALFLLGISMVGKFKTDKLHIPSLLILLKLLLLPILMNKIIYWVLHDTEMSNFAFFYGTFPPAPSLFIFALHYGINPDAVAITMILGTLISAPLIVCTSKMLHFTDVVDISIIRYYLSLATLITGTVLLLLFILNKKWRSITHKITMCIIASQLILAAGGLADPRWCLGGLVASRLWATILAIMMTMLHYKSFCWVLKYINYLIAVGFSVPVILGVCYATLISIEKANDVNFHFQAVESIILCSLDATCLFITVVFLVVFWKQKLKKKFDEESQACVNNENNDVDDDIISIEDLGSAPVFCSHGNCSINQRKECMGAVEEYKINHGELQLQRHFVLLVSLVASMTLGIFIYLGNALVDTPTGLIVELRFVYIFVTYGQGLIMALVFGTDGKFWTSTWELFQYSHFCRKFVKRHLADCKERITIGDNFLRGPALSDWLIVSGVASDVSNAEYRIQQLVQGGVIQKISDSLYKFN